MRAISRIDNFCVNISGKKYPGIYCIAISRSNLSDKKFSWIPQIKYIGMTNSIKGLKGRLDQFNHTILGKLPLHGGADRFRFEYENYETLTKKLFVSVCYFECDVKSNLPKDLRIMGEVCKFEFDNVPDGSDSVFPCYFLSF